VTDIGKHSSLLQIGKYFQRKKFYSTDSFSSMGAGVYLCATF